MSRGRISYSLISRFVAFAAATTWNFSGESESCPTVKAKFSSGEEVAHSGGSSEMLHGQLAFPIDLLNEAFW